MVSTKFTNVAMGHIMFKVHDPFYKLLLTEFVCNDRYELSCSAALYKH
jgi:hypothetical protein